jgi:molybdate transport system substrate-binding protein
MSGMLNFLSAGAAQGVLKALQPAFEAEAGVVMQGRFGAVGFIEDAFRAGEPCDLLVLTAAQLQRLEGEGLLQPGSVRPLGAVPTSVAVPAGAARPAVGSPEALRAALRAASSLHCPDIEKSTAGRHVAHVLCELGVWDELQPRLRNFPNGATAMAALAQAPADALGITQATEIRYTPGVQLVADLPPPLGLATVYAAALPARGTQPALAARLLAQLVGEASRALRREGGFQV